MQQYRRIIPGGLDSRPGHAWINITTIKWQESKNQLGFLRYESVSLILRSQFGRNVSGCQQNYNWSDAMLSAGGKCYKPWWCTKDEINDHISFLIYLFWLIDPGNDHNMIQVHWLVWSTICLHSFRLDFDLRLFMLLSVWKEPPY